MTVNTQTFLPRQKPGALGIRSEGILSFMESIKEQGLELHSFMLLRHGAVAAEAWWEPYGPDHPHMLYSLSKTFTATGIGFAVEEGLLDVKDTVISFFPQDVPSEPSAYLKAMTVYDLLIMATGHEQAVTPSLRKDPSNWVKAFLELPIAYEPGTQFVYNSGATYMLSAILHQVTGQGLLDYLTPRLLEPLGISSATWETCPRGIEVGGWGLKLKSEDIAKFGQMLLDKGMWDGRRIIYEQWVEEAAAKHISNDSNRTIDWLQGYGYQMWHCRHDAVRGDGMYGQFCILMPKQDAVVVITSAVVEMHQILDAVWNHLLPAMLDAPIEEEKEGLGQLQTCLAKAHYAPLAKNEAGKVPTQALTGASYRFKGSPDVISKLQLEAEDDGTVHLLIDNDHGYYRISSGSGQWLQSCHYLLDALQPVYSSAQWTEDGRLVIMCRYIETPFTYRLEYKFIGDELHLAWQQLVGASCTDEGEFIGTAVEEFN